MIGMDDYGKPWSETPLHLWPCLTRKLRRCGTNNWNYWAGQRPDQGRRGARELVLEEIKRERQERRAAGKSPVILMAELERVKPEPVREASPITYT